MPALAYSNEAEIISKYKDIEAPLVQRQTYLRDLLTKFRVEKQKEYLAKHPEEKQPTKVSIKKGEEMYYEFQEYQALNS